jgi:diacylglycerol kinase
MKIRYFESHEHQKYNPLRSAKYAINGLKYAFSNEPNLWIQFVVGWTFFGINMVFDQSILAVANLIFMAMVMSFELINTIVENLCDLIDPTYNPKIKVIKDLGAGAVLVTALVWLLIIIFGLVKILIWFLVR